MVVDPLWAAVYLCLVHIICVCLLQTLSLVCHVTQMAPVSSVVQRTPRVSYGRLFIRYKQNALRNCGSARILYIPLESLQFCCSCNCAMCVLKSGVSQGLAPKPLLILYGHDDEVTCVAISLELDVAVSSSKVCRVSRLSMCNRMT